MSPIQQIEHEIAQQIAKLNELRRATPPEPVKNYTFATSTGPATLLQLFGDQTTLLALHNMGQGCRYCTLWADGLNGLVAHLESQFAFVLLSKDPPEVQRAFANARGWRFRTASHAGTDYLREQSVIPGSANAPGLVCYQRRGDHVFKTNTTAFGPGDLYSPIWHMMALAGVGEDQWTPQYSYWQRPARLDDGGENVRG